MKAKITITTLMLMIFSASMFAQLKVYSDGSVTIDRDTLMKGSRLTIGDAPNFQIALPTGPRENVATVSYNPPVANRYNYGLMASSYSATAMSSGRSFGVMGAAGNCTSGYNYGVLGTLLGTANGAGVYGAVNQPYGTIVSGQYAGYFQGDVRITGTATITNLNTPSDIRLKDDVRYVGDGDSRHDIHSRLMDVHVISYKLKDINQEVGDTAKADTEQDERNRKTRYGVSAQELQALFPDLVEEGQDGYLAVNYMELVPMLICSVQELQREVSRLRGESEGQHVGSDSSNDESSTHQSLLEQCALYQNTPNPSSTQTVIRYKLPSTVTDSHIYILNLQGTLLRQVPVTPSLGSVTVSLSGLEPGMYLYSLVVAGHDIDTKRMIVAE